MVISEIEKFLSQLNDKIVSRVGNKIQEAKKQAIIDGKEYEANYLWCLYQIYLVQKNYTEAFWNMKDKKYESAWILLDRADIELSFLERHYKSYFGEFIGDKYNLLYILQAIKHFQILFPYRLFFSRESIIKEEKCSICGEKIRLRGGCKHKLGELYNGEQCSYVVTDWQLIAISIVTDPFDKYTFLKIEGQDYNYQVIEFLMDKIESPYDFWKVEKISVQNQNYKNVERNDRCPCGSGKKYKKCCMGTSNEMMDHFVFDIPRNKGI